MDLKNETRETRLAWFALRILDASYGGSDVSSKDVERWARAAGIYETFTITADDIRLANSVTSK